MRAPTTPRSSRYAINMTPMIDVVFLLIIFFLVSSHLARQESQVELELPKAESGVADDADDPRITVNLKPDGTILMAGQEISPSDLALRFAAAKQELGENMEVRVRGSEDCPYEFVEPILLACTKNGIWNLKFAVYEFSE